MRKLYLLLILWLVTLTTMAQGWPADYQGVMLQGFYWDSFSDTQWTRLEKQADDLATSFNLVWVPQSAKAKASPSNGYDPLYWFEDYTSSYGNGDELKSMINTFKNKGIGTIADVVINHRETATTWNDFVSETYNGKKYALTYEDICANDEAAQKGYEVGSNQDTGENWDGMRDLDHKSERVQNAVKAYLKMLLNDFGYAGFRYDMVKGYAGSYTKIYNEDAKPQFSVGECWDSSNTIRKWIDNTGKSSAAFDFQFRYTVRNAINKGDWSYLAKQNDGNWPLVSNDYEKGAYRQYAVTFVENHDTEKRANAAQDPIKKDTLAANAYLLAMPGTPCVFLKHWKSYKNEISKMIAVRKAVGIKNTSSYTNVASAKEYYAVDVTGENGQLLAVVGSKADSYTPEGSDWEKALSGYHYVYYVKGISAKSIKFPELSGSDFKAYDINVYVNIDQVGWASVNFWSWGGDETHSPKNANWPGDEIKNTKEINGKNWYYNTYRINSNEDYVQFVFSTGNDGSPQTIDSKLVTADTFFEISSEKDGNKYKLTDVTSTYTAIFGIQNVANQPVTVYSLDGKCVRKAMNGIEALNGLPKGIYIINKKKFILK